MESFVNKYFAGKLKSLRLKSDDIQDVLAAKFDMKQQVYCRLEQGKTNFSDNILDKICDEFNISRAEFVTSQSQLPQTNSVLKSNEKMLDDFSTKVIFAIFKKELIEKDLQIVDLQIALRKQKRYMEVTEDVEPIYVMI
jgi:transcriptional regulator with XRE-family HTH domain